MACYSLLAPIADDTGEEDPTEKPKGRHLGCRGNQTLKWSFIEAARGAVRKGGRFREVFDRHTQNGKVNRNRGYIKVARELVKIVYAVWRDERNYQPVALGLRERRKGRAAGPRIETRLVRERAGSTALWSSPTSRPRTSL